MYMGAEQVAYLYNFHYRAVINNLKN